MLLLLLNVVIVVVILRYIRVKYIAYVEEVKRMAWNLRRDLDAFINEINEQMKIFLLT